MLMMITMMMLMMMVMMMMMICLGLAALQWSHEASKSTAGENESTGDQDGVFPVQSCDQPERNISINVDGMFEYCSTWI